MSVLYCTVFLLVHAIHIKCMFDIVNAVNRCINVRCQTLVASDGIQGDLRQVICLHKPNSNVFWTT